MKYMDTNITETPVVPYRMERLYVYGSNRATVTVTGKKYVNNDFNNKFPFVYYIYKSLYIQNYFKAISCKSVHS